MCPTSTSTARPTDPPSPRTGEPRALTRRRDAVAAWAGRHPWWWLLAYVIGTAALYQLAIRAPLYPPFMIHPGPLDALIPLWPWTAAPYLSYFALMPSFVWLTRGHPERGRLLVAAALCVLGNLALNILVPTELTDPLRSEHAGGWLLERVIAGDTPRAALPSGHVALPVALAVLALRHRVRARVIYVPWALVLGVAILTTKQHYAPDLFGGVAWGLVAPLVVERALGLGRHTTSKRASPA